jgi:hypothetical protein
MSNPTLPVTYGTVSGTPIVGNVNSATLQAALVWVTLSADYVRSPDPGYPVALPGQAVTASLTDAPQTIPNGTRLQLYSDESAALVAAAAASYS